MHELSICQGIIEIAGLTLAGLPRPLPRLSAVTVRVGRLAGVVPECLRFHFDLLAAETPLAGAALVVEEVPIRGRCADCRAEFMIDTLVFQCPACGSGFVDLVSGRELQVVSLETVEEVACGS